MKVRPGRGGGLVIVVNSWGLSRLNEGLPGRGGGVAAVGGHASCREASMKVRPGRGGGAPQRAVSLTLGHDSMKVRPEGAEGLAQWLDDPGKRGPQ